MLSKQEVTGWRWCLVENSGFMELGAMDISNNTIYDKLSRYEWKNYQEMTIKHRQY